MALLHIGDTGILLDRYRIFLFLSLMMSPGASYYDQFFTLFIQIHNVNHVPFRFVFGIVNIGLELLLSGSGRNSYVE
jgi:hypothetical protein